MKLLFVIVMILLGKMRMAEEMIPMDNADIISFPSDHITAFNGTVPIAIDGLHAFCEWEYYYPCDWINTTYINESRMVCHLNKEEYEVLHAVVNCDSENMQLIQGSCNVELSLTTKRPLSWKPLKTWEGTAKQEPRYDQITRNWGKKFVVQIPSFRPSFIGFFCRFNATQSIEKMKKDVQEWMQPLRNAREQLQHAYGQIPSLKQIWKDIATPTTDAEERSAAAYRLAIFASILALCSVFFTFITLLCIFFPKFILGIGILILIIIQSYQYMTLFGPASQ